MKIKNITEYILIKLPNDAIKKALQNSYHVWEVMCPVERCKLIQDIITRITVYEDRVPIEPNAEEVKSLIAEAGMEEKR